MNNRILLSRIYNTNKGAFSTIKGNIVHEIINIFRCDDEKNYIYIAPYGKYIPKVQYVILTENAGKYKVRIKNLMV